nr:hypothetical protein [Sandaracinus amylolyticus]
MRRDRRRERVERDRARARDHVAAELLRAVDRAPRAYAASPVFRAFLRLAGMFPAWAEARMGASTKSLLALPG